MQNTPQEKKTLLAQEAYIENHVVEQISATTDFSKHHLLAACHSSSLRVRSFIHIKMLHEGNLHSLMKVRLSVGCEYLQ